MRYVYIKNDAIFAISDTELDFAEYTKGVLTKDWLRGIDKVIETEIEGDLEYVDGEIKSLAI